MQGELMQVMRRHFLSFYELGMLNFQNLTVS
jgi:hypothetical protein